MCFGLARPQDHAHLCISWGSPTPLTDSKDSHFRLANRRQRSHTHPPRAAKRPKATPDSPPPPGERAPAKPQRPRAVGGRDGPDPTRYGDWELNGRCIDF